ncbi:MAG: acetylgalactosaminidase, partial [Planctomycetota bacterium]
MKTQRREFLKMTGLAGLGFLGRGGSKGYAAQPGSCTNSDIPDMPRRIEEYARTRKQPFNMSGYAAPPI